MFRNSRSVSARGRLAAEITGGYTSSCSAAPRFPMNISGLSRRCSLFFLFFLHLVNNRLLFVVFRVSKSAEVAGK